jgi:DNA-binding transcriptional ArsR family regulator
MKNNFELAIFIVILLYTIMGLTKLENYTAIQNELAQMMKALAHPARIAIIEHLIKSNECICNDLVGVLGLAQATTSQHLRELKNAGIIKGKIEGTSVCYCIDSHTWDKYRETFAAFFVKVDCQDGCC